MTKKKQFVLVLGLLVLLIFIGWTAAGQKKDSTNRQVWEYRFEGNLSLDQVNQIGAAGWEMVNFTLTDSHGTTYAFKRAK